MDCKKWIYVCDHCFSEGRDYSIIVDGVGVLDLLIFKHCISIFLELDCIKPEM